MGEAVETEITLTKENSNVLELFSAGPNLMIYGLVGVLNPEGKDGVFVLDTSRINLDMGVRLPLHGKVSNLVVTNDYDFNGGDLEDVEKLIFKSETLNGFPMEISFQTYFLDEDNFIIDSLFSEPNNLLSAGLVNANGEVIEPEPATFEVILPAERVKNLEAAARIRVVAILNTENNQSAVKFLSTYFVDVQIGMQAEYFVEI